MLRKVCRNPSVQLKPMAVATHCTIYINREAGKINRLLQPTRSLYSTLAETLDVGFSYSYVQLVRTSAPTTVPRLRW